MFKQIVLISTFLSGITGLAYQMYWQRYLSFLVGSEARSISLVVAIFLLGLATGYEFWGRITSKINEKQKLLKIYGYIEIGIGAFALIFPTYFLLLKKIVYTSPSYLLIDLLVTILSLFLPTFLMGGTVPILTAYFPENENEVNDSHAKIYGLNSLGAFLGVFVGAFTVPKYGLSLSITLMGIINILIGLFFFLNKQSGVVQKQSVVPNIKNKFGDKLIYILVAITGAVSLGLEVILVRALGLAMGMSFMVFPIVLSLFILGLALGSLSLKNANKLDVKFLFQEMTKLIGFSLIIFYTIPYWPIWLNNIRVSIQSHNPGYYLYYILVYCFTALMILPTIFYFGRILPLGYSLLNKSGQNYGDKCGKLYFFNTCGTLFGSLVLGYLILYIVDIDTVLKICLITLTILIMYLQKRQGFFYKPSFVAAVIVLFTLFQQWNRSTHQYGIFRNRDLNQSNFKGLFHIPPLHLDVDYFKDGPNTTVAVLGQKGDIDSIITNGKSDGSTSDPNDYSTMTLASIYPYIYNSSDKIKAAVVGQGLALSAGLLGKATDVEHVDMLEISPFVIGTAKYFAHSNWDSHKNEKITTHEIDAFKFFANSDNDNKYHIISAEPSNPWVVGVENLFTNEFYQLVNKALKPEGIYLQWIHLYSMDLKIIYTVLHNLKREFKHVSLFWGGSSDLLFLASENPLSEKHLSSRLQDPVVVDALEKIVPRNTKEYMKLLNIYNEETIDFLYNTTIPLDHSFNRPQLNLVASKAFFRGVIIPKAKILDPYMARKFVFIGFEDYARIFLEHQNEVKDFCLNYNQFGKSKSRPTICKLYKNLNTSLQLFSNSQSVDQLLKSYSMLRKERMLNEDSEFLNKVKERVLKETKINEKLSMQLVNEYLKDHNFADAKIFVEEIRKRKDTSYLSNSLEKRVEVLERKTKTLLSR